MTALLEWPVRLLRHTKLTVAPEPFTRSAGVSLSGREQIVGSLAMRWRLDFDLAAAPPEIAREWPGWVTAMQGRLRRALIPLDHHLLYDLRDAMEPYSDGDFFADGTGFIYRGAVTFTEVLAAGAASALIETPPGHPLRIGDYFSLRGNLHQIIAPGRTGDVYPVWPPIPASVEAGTEIETKPPRILARLAEDDSGALALAFGRWGDPTRVSFISEIR
ncbi:hypothetical protein [Neomegalonema sp.]|uniref:hypothetical protein n=1 Tax=Neomegalonema sp. TaxID=2039713 RepID=UPI00261B2A3E|nr:hypothetical protein [Neomegalonema sp.]MDD2870240.1 hypothetical protein [Neomegalonema sp.]